MMVQADYWTCPSFRTGWRTALDAGRNLRDGMTAQRAAAPGPVPVRTSGLVAA
ncbi:hypothetical protein [Amycolatopsis sp. CA-126428]|uniref:hypothetical protein n=1 Tax=Amycolatopsis sp. CA-126428 TaxID=2073158 RepID=UPI001304F685|nr:hypothetical protein [Amycolatopsis sp. CA-126428]